MVSYPAKWPEVVAVAASTQTVRSPLRAAVSGEYSSSGTIDLVLWLNGTTRYLSGTSMAAPHVSGVAALSGAW